MNYQKARAYWQQQRNATAKREAVLRIQAKAGQGLPIEFIATTAGVPTIYAASVICETKAAPVRV